jgi:hypothetical protein
MHFFKAAIRSVMALPGQVMWFFGEGVHWPASGEPVGQFRVNRSDTPPIAAP